MFSPKKLCEFSAMLNYQRAKKFPSTTVSIVFEGNLPNQNPGAPLFKSMKYSWMLSPAIKRKGAMVP